MGIFQIFLQPSHLLRIMATIFNGFSKTCQRLLLDVTTIFVLLVVFHLVCAYLGQVQEVRIPIIASYLFIVVCYTTTFLMRESAVFFFIFGGILHLSILSWYWGANSMACTFILGSALSGMTYCHQNKQLVWLILFISIIALFFNLFIADNWQTLPFNPHPVPKEYVPVVSRCVLFLALLFAFFHGFRFVSEIQKSEQKLQAMVKALQHKNENLKQVNEELDKFVYSAAHDLRAPLTSVLGLVTLMELETKQPILLNYFQLIRKTVHKLDLFIRDIVSYSHNARIEVECQEVDLNSLIKNAFEQFAFIENANKIRHSVSLTGSAVIFSDQNRIEVILNNLISNAIKYADFNKAESFIEVNLITTNAQVQISVIDNGQGIEEKHLPKIFNMFYRANQRATGSGIGLYIAQETAKKLSGNLAVHSTLGIGTTMMLCFPNQIRVNEKVQEKKPVLEAVV